MTTTIEAGGGRYVVEECIGRGGMAVVYRALDKTSGRRVALKRHRPPDNHELRRRSLESFEREFHTLAQLSHPRIVTAFDYGVDVEVPYYTMELLDGGDLVARAPMPWHEACSVARDVCSALSLVHSRRMVYRDLSPRNVRCTSDGKAKLLDFGAMAPMGAPRLAICTPMVAAPEVAHQQPLDGRSDLYALGATLYFALTRRTPYPARSFRELDRAWERPLHPPSEWASEIPEALDALVMDLLQLDPRLRPVSAAEVSRRLEAIAGLEADEDLLISQAYLITPTLVGREQQLESLKEALRGASEQGAGGAFMVRGATGSGRTRFLDACVLQAKLAGLTVMRASPTDAADTAYAAAKIFTDALFEAAGEAAAAAAMPHRAVLEQVLPSLAARLPGPKVAPPTERREAPLAALRSFFLGVAKDKPVLIAIDDFDRFDVDSQALVALLARAAPKHPIVVVATAHPRAESELDTVEALGKACSPLELQPLDAEQTRSVLASMFGDVPNLEGLVRRIHTLAAGNPQNLVRVAQHLLDRGSVRYDAGAWVLPERLDDAALPETMAQALQAAVVKLSGEARNLARAMAEWPEQRFTANECTTLTGQDAPAYGFSIVDELVSAGVVAPAVDGYVLESKAWTAALSEPINADLEIRLARVFKQRADGLRAARHLFHVGRDDEGLDVLIAFAEESTRKTDSSMEEYVKLLSTLPEDWNSIFQRGIALCDEHERCARERFILENRVTGILSQSSTCSNGHLLGHAQKLARGVGLDVFSSLDPNLDPAERLQRSLAEAGARYARSPEHDRLFEPGAAIQHLARCVILAIGHFSRTMDAEEWRQIPSLRPLAALSPAVAIVDGLARGFDARISGRFEEACEIYRGLLEKLEANEAGLDQAYVEGIRAALVNILGTLDAVLGLPSAEEWANTISPDPLYHGSALAIRRLARLWEGDSKTARRLERETELWRLEQPRQQAGDVLTLLWSLQARSACGDLMGTHHALEAIERMASKMHTWQPIAGWARGEYERIRGAFEASLASLNGALEQLEPGKHQIWPLAAAARLKVLCEQERFEEACSQGRRDLAEAEAVGLGYLSCYIRMPLAVALAHSGQADAAWEEVRAVEQTFETLGARGLNVGLAFETGARVASALGDSEAFERYAGSCKEIFRAHDNPSLAARYRRLLREASRAQLDLDESSFAHMETTAARSQIESVMTCSTAAESLKRGLDALVTSAAAETGFLYCINDGSVSLCARLGDRSPPPEVDAAARRLIERQMSDAALGTQVETEVVDANAQGLGDDWPKGPYRPLLLGHTTPEGFVITGLAVLEVQADDTLGRASRTATDLSRAFAQRGDVTGTLIVA